MPDIAGAASGAAAVLALVLAIIAYRAHRVTRSPRPLLLAIGFLVSAGEALLLAWLLLASASVPASWLAVPVLHAASLVVLYAALLRV